MEIVFKKKIYVPREIMSIIMKERRRLMIQAFQVFAKQYYSVGCSYRYGDTIYCLKYNNKLHIRRLHYTRSEFKEWKVLE